MQKIEHKKTTQEALVPVPVFHVLIRVLIPYSFLSCLPSGSTHPPVHDGVVAMQFFVRVKKGMDTHTRRTTGNATNMSRDNPPDQNKK